MKYAVVLLLVVLIAGCAEKDASRSPDSAVPVPPEPQGLTAAEEDSLRSLANGNPRTPDDPLPRFEDALRHCSAGSMDPSWCYMGVAAAFSNTSLCPLALPGFPLDYCYRFAAGSTADCDMITDEHVKESCYAALGAVYEAKQVPAGFPSSLLQRSAQFLEQSYGSAAMANVEFVEGRLDAYSWGGGGAHCDILLAPDFRDGTKYELLYKVSGLLPEERYVAVVFDDAESLYCAREVLNCTGQPSHCPPYDLSTAAHVRERYSGRCGPFEVVSFDTANLVKNPVWPPTISTVSRLDDSAYVWRLGYRDHCAPTARHCITEYDVVIDPKSGNVLSDPKLRCG